MAGPAARYDCQTCGACCRSPWAGDGYVRLHDIDLERLQGLSLPIIDQEQGDFEVIPKLGTKWESAEQRICAAFTGQVAKSCSCSIYEHRPEACREYEVGGALCRQARQKAGLPV
jgi:Fe-S-cluster containining protein